MDEKDFLKLTKLCRIECSDEEKKKLMERLKKVLVYVEQLKEVDTAGVNPCNHVLETVHNVMREDVVGETLPRDQFLSNAPAHTGGMIRVPPVIT